MAFNLLKEFTAPKDHEAFCQDRRQSALRYNREPSSFELQDRIKFRLILGKY
jgi:hypothetical protein